MGCRTRDREAKGGVKSTAGIAVAFLTEIMLLRAACSLFSRLSEASTKLHLDFARILLGLYYDVTRISIGWVLGAS